MQLLRTATEWPQPVGLCMCVCVSVGLCMCVCVCMVYVHMYVCTWRSCVCVCLCAGGGGVSGGIGRGTGWSGNLLLLAVVSLRPNTPAEEVRSRGEGSTLPTMGVVFGQGVLLIINYY